MGRRVLHSATISDAQVSLQRVLIVEAGNFGAQIVAELSKVARTTWVSLQAPAFHPDKMGDHILFDRATAQYQVLSPSQIDGKARGVLQAKSPFERFTETGIVGRTSEFWL